MNWHKYKNFTEDEFKCSHTGECHMDKNHMRKLQALRTEAGFPFIVSSGYRHPTHPIEASKNRAGEHSYGKGTDIEIGGWRADRLIQLSYKHGFTRRGIHQNGGAEYIHLGTGLPNEGFPPGVWSY